MDDLSCCTAHNMAAKSTACTKKKSFILYRKSRLHKGSTIQCLIQVITRKNIHAKIFLENIMPIHGNIINWQTYNNGYLMVSTSRYALAGPMR